MTCPRSQTNYQGNHNENAGLLASALALFIWGLNDPEGTEPTVLHNSL